MASSSARRVVTYRNRVRLIRGGRPYFDLLKKSIDEAEQTIHLQTYRYADDSTGRAIGDALIRAAGRGVHVYVLADGYASQDISREFIDRLKEARVNFRLFNPLMKSRYFYFGRRLHHKVFVVDGQRALVGGINVSDRYNDTPEGPAWMDWALWAEGEVVPILETVCRWRMKSWRGRRKYRNMPVGYPMSPTDETVPVRVRINDWVRGRREISQGYLEMFRKANGRLTIMSSYFLPGIEFRKALGRAARRGVQVRIIVASTSDVTLAKYAEKYLYRWMFRNNITIYEYQPTVLHAKIAVCDCHTVTVGSYNVNNISAYASIELNLEVHDAAFAMSTEKKLEEIMKNDCVLITEQAHSRTNNWFKRLLHYGAFELFKFLFFLFTFYFKSVPKE